MIENILMQYPAKTYNNGYGVSVFVHSLIVGIVAQEFIKIIPKSIVNKYELNNYPFFVSLHDVGKISPGFREMINYNLKNSNYSSMEQIEQLYITKHEQISSEYLKNEFPELFDDVECILAFIRWHHGKFRMQKTEWNWDHSAYGENEYDEHRKLLVLKLKEFFGYSNSFVKLWKSFKKGNFSKCILDHDVKYMMGFLSVCDWIGSDEEIFNPIDYLGDIIDENKIRESAKNALIKYGFQKIDIKKDLKFETIFNGYKPTSIQNCLFDVVDRPGIYVVEAPMGVGKTEAAEFAAYNCLVKGIVDGVYFAMPTQITSNSIFDRFKKFSETISNNLNSDDIRLTHDKAIFYENNSGMNSWFKGKRSILSPFSVGTIDQALMSVLPQYKHFYLRTFGLIRKCVIIDEVHSYDAYMNNLNKELINQMVEMGCVVILLSATLTKKTRNDLCGDESNVESYPLITKVCGDNVSHHSFKTKLENKNVKINFVYVNNNLHEDGYKFRSSRRVELEKCLEKINHGQKILWIENTVKEAQEIYNWFDDKVEKGILHSKFTNKDRRLNEEKWIKKFGKNSSRENGMILISTQVCEQSIDIDADYLVTALCPSDMLFQRIGRLQRHAIENRNIIPECTILTSEEFDKNHDDLQIFERLIGNVSFVYSPYILRKTYKIWKELKDINIPKDIREILEKTYDNSNDDEFDIKLRSKKIRMDNEKLRKSESAKQVRMQTQDDDLNFNDDDENGTRYFGIPTIDLILVKEIIDNSSFKNLYGESFELNSKMDMTNRKIIDNSSIRVPKKFLDKNMNLVQVIKIGKIEYKICLVKSERIIDFTTSKMSDFVYSENFGFC